VAIGPEVAQPGGSAVTAEHPPLFPALLAIASRLGLRSYHQHLLVGCAFGAGTIAVVAAIGRRLAGPALGLAAAAIAAVYLPLIVNDSMLMSESLYGLTIAITILAALWFLEQPGPRRGALLGAALGLAALTRAESLLLVLVLVPFLLRRAGGTRLRSAAAILVATAVVVAPWCIRNTLVFHRPTAITTGDGGVLAGANLHSTYYHGPLLGAWDLTGLSAPPGKRPEGEAADAARLRRQGLDYAARHVGRIPVVAAVRVLRTWGLYPFDPGRQVAFNTFNGSHVRRFEWATLVSHWLALLLAIPGLLWIGARGMPRAPLVAPLLLVTLVSVLFFGDFRFRQAANPALVVLATLGAVALFQRIAHRERTSTS
jgi:Dolichyl-phosphate-mannose-protein mannosyltransferase